MTTWLILTKDNLTGPLSNMTAMQKLANLPATLTYLDCRYLQLTSLSTTSTGAPIKLPSGLILLYCAENQLTNLPDNLPATLKTLWCSYNKLTILPDLPESLEYIDLRNNPLEANYPEIYTYWAYEGKKIITYINECNAKRRARVPCGR